MLEKRANSHSFAKTATDNSFNHSDKNYTQRKRMQQPWSVVAAIKHYCACSINQIHTNLGRTTWKFNILTLSIENDCHLCIICFRSDKHYTDCMKTVVLKQIQSDACRHIVSVCTHVLNVFNYKYIIKLLPIFLHFTNQWTRGSQYSDSAVNGTTLV